MSLDEEERREYYRIDDRIALEIHVLTDSEASETGLLQDASPLFNLLSELHLSEFESQHLLRQVNEADRTLANFLKAQNKRIDLLSQVVAQTLLNRIGEPQPVTLSEGGITLSQARPMRPGTALSIKMALMPQALGLLLRAQVVHCSEQPNAEGLFEVGTEFVALADAQRQLLARYILQRQQQERRLARDQLE
jgi:c-di-GMP-binding flagellar brake protein YcgR